MEGHVQFRVQADTNPGETVCLSGSCEALGRWHLSDVVPLSRATESHDGQGDLWTGVVYIPDDSHVVFRYIICVILGERQVIVRRWETNLAPRRLPVAGETDETPHQFGSYDNNFRIQGGWVTVETVVQLKIYNSPIQIWKRRYSNKRYQIKMTAIDLRRHDSEALAEDESTEDLNDIRNKDWPIVEIAVMNEDECEFALQQQFGRVYSDDEVLMFQAQVLFPEKIAYMMDFYLYDPSLADVEGVPEHVGFSYILPSVFHNTTGVSVVPITGIKHTPIGQLTVEYLVIRPMRIYECDASVSYAKHWNRGRKTLEVGHRGSGSSFKTTPCNATIRENTVASLKHAGNHGADFVEFDVQLSKDLVPIIYHDFHVCICTRKKYLGDDSELLEVPVQDLTLKQVQGLKVHHLTEKPTNSTASSIRSFANDDHEDHQPFPTLRKALESVDPHVGFNVEIKWNLRRKDGTQELSNPMEVNLYLDRILKDLLENAGSRRIVISCFHPDICTMIRLKQNKYPVLFLTQGQSKKYQPYLDPRTSSIPMAIHFARSAGILGIDVHTEDILEDQSLVQLCKNAGLIMFCWGEDNNDPKVITALKNLGLDGIIYDRIDEHKEIKENIFLMEAKSRRGILEAARLSANTVPGILSAPFNGNS